MSAKEQEPLAAVDSQADSKTSRRSFLRKATMAGVAGAGFSGLLTLGAPRALGSRALDKHDEDHDGRDDDDRATRRIATAPS